VLAAQLRYGCASLRLLEHGQDLAVGESRFLHGTSAGKTKRKFNFWRQLTGGGITEGTLMRLTIGRATGGTRSG